MGLFERLGMEPVPRTGLIPIEPPVMPAHLRGEFLFQRNALELLCEDHPYQENNLPIDETAYARLPERIEVLAQSLRNSEHTAREWNDAYRTCVEQDEKLDAIRYENERRLMYDYVRITSKLHRVAIAHYISGIGAVASVVMGFEKPSYFAATALLGATAYVSRVALENYRKQLDDIEDDSRRNQKRFTKK
jgi:hypothetical protein